MSPMMERNCSMTLKGSSQHAMSQSKTSFLLHRSSFFHSVGSAREIRPWKRPLSRTPRGKSNQCFPHQNVQASKGSQQKAESDPSNTSSSSTPPQPHHIKVSNIYFIPLSIPLPLQMCNSAADFDGQYPAISYKARDWRWPAYASTPPCPGHIFFCYPQTLTCRLTADICFIEINTQPYKRCDLSIISTAIDSFEL